MLLLIVEYVLIRQSGEKRGIEVTPTLSAQSHGKVTVKPLVPEMPMELSVSMQELGHGVELYQSLHGLTTVKEDCSNTLAIF